MWVISVSTTGARPSWRTFYVTSQGNTGCQPEAYIPVLTVRPLSSTMEKSCLETGIIDLAKEPEGVLMRDSG